LKPNIVIFYVNDPTASARFYGRLFEINPIEQSPGFVMFALSPGMMFALWKRQEVAPAVSAMPGAAELTVTVDSRDAVDITFEKWQSDGITITLAPTRLDFGYGFAARDLDGHVVRVFTPGSADS